MGITKLKPARTPRIMDQWTESKVAAREEVKRNSQNAIQNSKKLVEQSKEILARVESRQNKSAKLKAS